MSDPLPIGVFDSGVGGLTVLRALRERLPAADFIYLGDTARLPYGTRTAETVERYALQAASVLVESGIAALVVACNTASSVAVEALRAAFAPLPVFGVLEPGAEAAASVSRSGRIGVLATESTVAGGAYARAILRRRGDARVRMRACQLFVALAEEGWTSGPAVEAIVERYVGGWFDGWRAPDTLLLGCTHFPVLASALRTRCPRDVELVDSASTTAELVARTLTGQSGAGSLRLLATDGVDRFARVGSRFLGQGIRAAEVELVDLPQVPFGA